MKKKYKLVNPLEKENLIILSIAQTNWWAFAANIIRLGAFLSGEKEAISHTAIAFYYDNRFWVAEKTLDNFHFSLYAKRFKNFVGKIYAHLSPYPINDKLIKIFLEATIPDYSIVKAINSQINILPNQKDNEKIDFCSDSVADIIEKIAEQDIFPGDNAKRTPSELFDFMEKNQNFERMNEKNLK